MSELRPADLEVLGTLEELEFVAQGQAETWRARTQAGEPVIVKIYRFEDASSWKGLELFRREIQVLEQLNHPGIPKYLWHREVEVDDILHIYLVQECVEGETLTNYRLKDVGELDRIIQGVLDILIYLQNFTPPVVHRDVKPSNIIISPDRVFLVDFGAVQVVTPSDDGGSTVVGTSGYMPFEQLMGRAVPASDLYGLGMTLIELVTGKTPDLLAMTDMRPIWENQLVTPLTEAQRVLLRNLTEPFVEDRTPDAKRALEAVQTPQRSLTIRKPKDMKTQVQTSGAELVIQTPGTNHAALFGYLFTVVFFAAFLYAITGDPVTSLVVGGVGLVFFKIVAYVYIQTSCKLVVYPKYWRLFTDNKLVSEGSLRSLIGFEREGSPTDAELLLVTRDHSFPLKIAVSEEESRFLTAALQSFVSGHT